MALNYVLPNALRMRQAPGAQLLSITAGENVTPDKGLGGTPGVSLDTCQMGSLLPIGPCPVDSVAGLGNVCAKTDAEKTRTAATSKYFFIQIKGNF